MRQKAKIAVSFTKREFKTPQRETYKEQEDEVREIERKGRGRRKTQ